MARRVGRLHERSLLCGLQRLLDSLHPLRRWRPRVRRRHARRARLSGGSDRQGNLAGRLHEGARKPAAGVRLRVEPAGDRRPRLRSGWVGLREAREGNRQGGLADARRRRRHDGQRVLVAVSGHDWRRAPDPRADARGTRGHRSGKRHRTLEDIGGGLPRHEHRHTQRARRPRVHHQLRRWLILVRHRSCRHAKARGAGLAKQDPGLHVDADRDG